MTCLKTPVLIKQVDQKSAIFVAAGTFLIKGLSFKQNSIMVVMMYWWYLWTLVSDNAILNISHVNYRRIVTGISKIALCKISIWVKKAEHYKAWKFILTSKIGKKFWRMVMLKLKSISFNATKFLILEDVLTSNKISSGE